MKKMIIFMLCLGLLAYMAYPVDLELGLNFGGRTVSDKEIKEVYGSGIIYFPYLSIKVWKGIRIGAGYEGGYSRNGEIGIYSEPATLKITGFELFVSHQFKLKKWRPFLKLGYGFYSYKQTVESTYADDIDEKTSGFSMAGGIKLYIYKGFFAGMEFKYVPLKVTPVDIEVDLGGLRYAITIGYNLGFHKKNP